MKLITIWAMILGFIIASLVLTAYTFWSIVFNGPITLHEFNKPILYIETALITFTILWLLGWAIKALVKRGG